MNLPKRLVDFDPEEIHDKAVSLGEDWVDKNAAATLLEETRKVLLAKLTRESNAKSHADRETEAKCRDEYSAHIIQEVEARRLADHARVKYEQAKTWIEMRRSVESTQRAAMNLR